MRTEDAQELRARASAWLRAGIMEAVLRYELANIDPESEISADRQNDYRDMTAPRRIHPRAPPRDNGQQLFLWAA